MTSTPNLYPVHLTPEQRASFEDITRNGQAPAKKIRHAQVLLMSARDRPGGKMTGPEVAAALGMHINTVARIRKRFALEGEQPALERRPRVRWTMKLLAGELVRREVVDAISDETVRLALKKKTSSPGRCGRGACPSGTTPGSSPTWRSCSTSTPRTTPRGSP